MLVEVKVPALSESVAEATLLSWHKKEGEHVDRDENLIDIETDKVVLELPAPAAGVLAKIIKGDGTTVTGGEIIATIDTEAAPAETKAAPAAAPRSGACSTNTGTVQPVPLPRAASLGACPAGGSAGDDACRAEHLAAQANFTAEEISSIKGSGRDGRITKEDVAAHVEKKPSPSARLLPRRHRSPALRQLLPFSFNGGYACSRQPRPRLRVTEPTKGAMSRLRARIAERLVQSQSTAAILTTFNEVNMQAIMDLRARYKDEI